MGRSIELLPLRVNGNVLPDSVVSWLVMLIFLDSGDFLSFHELRPCFDGLSSIYCGIPRRNVSKCASICKS
jgi:hypothetical protein